MSKCLEELKDLKSAFIGHCRELKCEENYIKVCENKFGKIEKELNALEILKTKLSPLAKSTFLPMTQEEFNLLNEVLNDEH